MKKLLQTGIAACILAASNAIADTPDAKGYGLTLNSETIHTRTPDEKVEISELYRFFIGRTPTKREQAGDKPYAAIFDAQAPQLYAQAGLWLKWGLLPVADKNKNLSLYVRSPAGADEYVAGHIPVNLQLFVASMVKDWLDAGNELVFGDGFNPMDAEHQQKAASDLKITPDFDASVLAIENGRVKRSKKGRLSDSKTKTASAYADLLLANVILSLHQNPAFRPAEPPADTPPPSLLFFAMSPDGVSKMTPELMNKFAPKLARSYEAWEKRILDNLHVMGEATRKANSTERTPNFEDFYTIETRLYTDFKYINLAANLRLHDISQQKYDKRHRQENRIADPTEKPEQQEKLVLPDYTREDGNIALFYRHKLENLNIKNLTEIFPPEVLFTDKDLMQYALEKSRKSFDGLENTHQNGSLPHRIMTGIYRSSYNRGVRFVERSAVDSVAGVPLFQIYLNRAAETDKAKELAQKCSEQTFYCMRRQYYSDAL